MEGISIVVPVYNVEKYLAKCLASLCAQDGCVKEIVLINDGSTDNSLSVCREYADKDGRIKIIDQENQGLSAAVRTGVRNAKCEYIGFVDSDDFVEEEMFKRMFEEMTEHNADVVWCEYDRIGENGRNLSKPLHDKG
ncbi:MAG: glycosyltransferase, partial [Clostridiales bacterium]|nr:glycosyltransferase [Clostridiales bacterium]